MFMLSKRIFSGETGAGKTTLINQLVGKKIFGTAYLATTGPIIKIRDSETMKIKCYLKDSILEREEEVTDFKKLKSIIKELTDISTHPADMDDIYCVDVYMPVSLLKVNYIRVSIGNRQVVLPSHTIKKGGRFHIHARTVSCNLIKV